MKRNLLLLFVIVSFIMLSACNFNEIETPPGEETPTEEINVNKLPDFEGTDLYGNTVTQEIFYDFSLTMVNIWGTFCNPCIEEMPDLAQLHQEILNEDINIVGILVDVSEENNKDFAIEITESYNVEFTNIIPDDNLLDYLSEILVGVPTSLFIDEEGNIIGEPVIGARGKDDYKQIIFQRVEEFE